MNLLNMLYRAKKIKLYLTPSNEIELAKIRMKEVLIDE